MASERPARKPQLHRPKRRLLEAECELADAFGRDRFDDLHATLLDLVRTIESEQHLG